ncbi:hypothetical protein [Microbacterium invictum]|uniref:Glycoside hydrolase family 65 n=1 Tax=Microbacterium invictum TaxID=515415 RepID=A0AA40SR08_9MICO|nr:MULTISPECIES: hypothetical protein [Microbacterium]MBB4140798.1 hypothetical protein [Microbacterium invictum]
MTSPIDRRAVIDRHAIRLTAPDPRNPLTVGNGNFAYTADITGMQTFRDEHDPDLAEEQGRLTVDTCTMSTWGWHSMPNPEGFELAHSLSTYQTARGEVSYPDKLDIPTILGRTPVTEETRPSMWLHVNPQRIDLGRIGLRLSAIPGGDIETAASALEQTTQHLDLWTGTLTSRFRYAGEEVTVITAADPETATVGFRISSSLLTDGRLTVSFAFPYASDSFHRAGVWTHPDRHLTESASHSEGATFLRELDDTSYRVHARWNRGELINVAPHEFLLRTRENVLELTAEFDDGTVTAHTTEISVDSTLRRSAQHWRSFWTNGAAIDLSGSTDPRAFELERRIVLSQYLTAVNSSGDQPPQETGLVTNSWQGKFHLEMHWWHAAHFATWGRPELLARSIGWYESVLDVAQETARRQGYMGARWPKQTGPDGRESPTDIGSFLVWQQPHIIYFAELLRRAGVDVQLLNRLEPLVEETAVFMSSYAEKRSDGYHLPAPIMPAQEFYDPTTTEDPTFELAYWWWGLEIAQQWRERAERSRNATWDHQLAGLVNPHVLDGIYTAIGTPPFTRVDDHPSMLAALGMIPATPLIHAATHLATLGWVKDKWDWDTAWGWDFPVLAMAATRAGDPQAAIDALMLDASKNQYLMNGHNPQMGNFLPIYLPGNGGLLAAVSLMCAGWDGSEDTPGFPSEGWSVRHEGLLPWP